MASGMHITADHWLNVARRCPSPYSNERPAHEISLTVVHNISLPPGCFGGPHIDRLFTGSLRADEHPYFETIAGMEVSAHLLIRRDGEIVQYVPFDRRAWHAGRSSWRGRENCNDFSVGIELEGCDDQPFEPVQYERLAKALAALWRTYPAARDALAGHSDIAPGRKTDPGPCFDWQHLEGLLAEGRTNNQEETGSVQAAPGRAEK